MSWTKAGQFGPQGVINQFGRAQPGATLALYQTDGLTLATRWADADRTAAAANPWPADADGDFTAYADPGRYLLRVTVAGVSKTFPVTVPPPPPSNDLLGLVERTDIAPALAAALAALPAAVVEKVPPVTGQQRIVGGGGEVRLPPGDYYLDATIVLSPGQYVRLDGTRLISRNPVPQFQNATVAGEGGAGTLYNRDAIGILGRGVLDGAYVGTTAIDWLRADHTVLDNVKVLRFTGDGIVFRECQWWNWGQVEVEECGGRGIVLDCPIGGGLPCSDGHFTKVMCQRNKGGTADYSGPQMYVAKANGISGVSLTIQGSKLGKGLVLHGGSIVGPGAGICSFSVANVWLEENKTHVSIEDDVTSGRPRGVTFHGGSWICSPETERFMVNEGDWTAVFGFGGTNSANLLLAKNGVKALFEQSSTKGNLLLVGPGVVTGAALVVYEDGTIFKATNASPKNHRVAIVRMTPGSEGRLAGFAYDNIASDGTAEGPLKIGPWFVWVDPDGQVSVKSSTPTSWVDVNRRTVGQPRAAESSLPSDRSVAGCAIGAGSTTLTSTALFVASDEKLTAVVPGAALDENGNAVPLVAPVVTFTDTSHVVLAVAADVAVSGVTVTIGGSFRPGQVYFNSAPALGGPVGWVVLSVSPVVWAPFGQVGISATYAAAPVSRLDNSIVDDPTLLVHVPGAGTWRFEARVRMDGSAAGDGRFQLGQTVGQVTAANWRLSRAPGTGTAALSGVSVNLAEGSLVSVINAGLVGVGTVCTIVIEGELTATAACDLPIRWGQNATDGANATTRNIGSWADIGRRVA